MIIDQTLAIVLPSGTINLMKMNGQIKEQAEPPFLLHKHKSATLNTAAAFVSWNGFSLRLERGGRLSLGVVADYSQLQQQNMLGARQQKRLVGRGGGGRIGSCAAAGRVCFYAAGRKSSGAAGESPSVAAAAADMTELVHSRPSFSSSNTNHHHPSSPARAKINGQTEQRQSALLPQIHRRGSAWLAWDCACTGPTVKCP